MSPPDRRRPSPKKRCLGPAPAGVDLETLANQVRYVGSPEHKDGPSFAGHPRPRGADATICDRRFLKQQDLITSWLQDAIRAGTFGEYWENGFPRYIWARHDGVVYEARLTNIGEYKGWALSDESEWPRGLP